MSGEKGGGGRPESSIPHRLVTAQAGLLSPSLFHLSLHSSHLMLREINPALLQQLDRVLGVDVVVKRELKVELPSGTVLRAVALGIGKREAELDDLRVIRGREGWTDGGTRMSSVVLSKSTSDISIPTLPSLSLSPSLRPLP